MSDSISASIAVMKNDIKHIMTVIDTDRDRINTHIETSDDYRDRVTKLEGSWEGFRITMGIIVALQIAQIGIVFVQ